MRYKRGVGLLGLLIRFGERTAMEALLVRSRRVKTATENPVIGASILGSFVMWPVVVALFTAWLLTGRGPAMRILAWNAGAPRQRPPR